MTANISADVQALKESVAVLANNQDHLFKANDKTNDSLHEVSNNLIELTKKLGTYTESNRHLINDQREIKKDLDELKSEVKENDIQMGGVNEFITWTRRAVYAGVGIIVSLFLVLFGLYLRQPDNTSEMQAIIKEQNELIGQMADRLNHLEILQ